jgi:hypothetical protein
LMDVGQELALSFGVIRVHKGSRLAAIRACSASISGKNKSPFISYFSERQLLSLSLNSSGVNLYS